MMRYKKNDGPYATLWKFWRTGGMETYNHGWNAPKTILSQYIVGVAPVEAGEWIFVTK